MQIETQYHSLADMWGGVGERGSPRAKTVCRSMWRDSIKDLAQDPALNALERWLGGFDETKGTRSARLPMTNIVTHLEVRLPHGRAFDVGKPVETSKGHIQPGRKLCWRSQRWQLPRSGCQAARLHGHRHPEMLADHEASRRHRDCGIIQQRC